MGHVFRLMGWLSLVLLSAWACGGDHSDPAVSIGDCQRVGEACGAGLVCQADAAGVLVCLPASDGGVDGHGGQRRPCDGQPEGHVLVEGDYSACTFVDDCSEMGEQTRMNSVCRGGATVEEPQTQACQRDTDGTVVSQSDFASCTFADACIETGEQTRTNSVCRDGVAVDEVEAAACVRDTDGTIVSQPEFGACGGFDDLCDRTGEQTRTNSVCRDGVASDEGETQVCERDDPGMVADGNRVAVCMTEAGGRLELPGGQLVVPADALAEPTELFLERVEDAPLAIEGLAVLGPIFNAGPVDSVLALPATISARFDGDPDRAALFVEQAPDFRRLGGQVIADAVQGQIDQLGTFLVADGVDYRLNVDRDCGALQTVDGRVQEPSTVALFLTANDCAGRPLTNLEDADFEILEDDQLLGDGVVRRVLPQDGMHTFVTVVLDLSASTRDHLDEVIAGARSLVSRLKEGRDDSVQIGIEVFAGDRELTRWQAPNLETAVLLDRLSAIGEFTPEADDVTNLNGAIVQGLERLAADTERFRLRNRGGAFTTEHLVVFTDGADTAGFEDSAAVQARLAAHSAEVTIVGLASPELSTEALSLIFNDVLVSPSVASLRRDFQASAARIVRAMERTYLLAYCTPQQDGEHTVTVRLRGAENQTAAQFGFTAADIAAPGCGDVLFDTQCEDKQCGGLGCGFCDDRTAGCNPSDQCQNYCETDPVTAAVPVADRCDYPNPQGYVQFCEQDISARCGETCTDLANDPENCGRCGLDCGPNVVGIVDGDRTVGGSCQDSVCQCAPGWYGAACDQTRCGDGFLTPDEVCDDGNLDAGDGCGVDCVIEEFWACDQSEPSRCDGIRGDARVRGTEACDDGIDVDADQPVDGDGCSALGEIETGYSCEGEPSLCVSRCGDGLVASDELCDEGNGSQADGCSDTCVPIDDTVCAADCDRAGTEPALAAVRVTLNGEGPPNAHFGTSVAIAGETAIVGAPGYVVDDEQVGAAYLVDLTVADPARPYAAVVVTAENGQAGDAFGASVARSQRTAAVGAPARLEGTGVVYVFDRQADGSWVQSILRASDGAVGDRFGHSVAIAESGRTIVVGAYHDDDGGESSGSVYVYTRSRVNEPWQETKLTASDGSADAEFGASVAVADRALIVGAAGDDERGEQSGSAYIFERQADGSWRERKLAGVAGADWDAGDRFGSSVDMSGGAAIVGAPGSGDGSGSAFIFTRQADGGYAPARLANPEGVWAFGQRVAIDDGTAVVGQNLSAAPREAEDWIAANYLYEQQGDGDWMYTRIQLPADLTLGEFGPSLDISGGAFITGSGGGIDGDNQGVSVFASAPQCYAEGENAASCYCRAGAAGPDCAARPDLGDGLIQAAEQCDDGNVESGDGCSDLGVIERGFYCEGEPSVCVTECGDVIVAGDESCDDGNADDDDACSARCDFGDSHGQGWVQVASLPRAFSETHHSFAFSFGGLGYIVGGNSSTGVRDDFYQYDPVQNAWTELEPFPGVARGFAIGDTWDGKAYYGFGRGGGSFLNDLWVFDPADLSWTELASCPCPGRAHPALVAQNGKILMGMGNDSGGNKNDWWEYDIASNTWAQRDDLPSVPRHHPYQFGIDEAVYTGFGHGNGIFNTWYRYDIDEETWSQVASLPAEGRVAGTQFSYDGIGYVLSGDGEDHRSMDTGEFWAYDPVADTWSELPPHPWGSRWAPASFIIDGEVYLINGMSFRQYVSEIYKYDLRSSP